MRRFFKKNALVENEFLDCAQPVPFQKSAFCIICKTDKPHFIHLMFWNQLFWYKMLFFVFHFSSLSKAVCQEDFWLVCHHPLFYLDYDSYICFSTVFDVLCEVSLRWKLHISWLFNRYRFRHSLHAFATLFDCRLSTKSHGKITLLSFELCKVFARTILCGHSRRFLRLHQRSLKRIQTRMAALNQSWRCIFVLARFSLYWNLVVPTLQCSKSFRNYLQANFCVCFDFGWKFRRLFFIFWTA